MIAWVSPSRIVSVTPLRISLSSSSVLTVTWRSLISRVLMWCFSFRWSRLRSTTDRSLGCDAVQGGGDVDVHVGAADVDGERGDRLGGREPGGLAGAEVEARAVQPALDRAALDLALAEGHGRVGA